MNDTIRADAPISGEHATHALFTDFNGIAVDTSLAGAGIGTYRRSVNGYLFSFFRLDAGAARYGSPDGSGDSQTRAGLVSFRHMGPSTGDWTFTIDAGAKVVPDSPVLWMVEIPDQPG